MTFDRFAARVTPNARFGMPKRLAAMRAEKALLDDLITIALDDDLVSGSG
jgi:hypothetical protein